MKRTNSNTRTSLWNELSLGHQAMKRIIGKKVWCLVLALFLVSLTQDVNAQSQESQAIATQFGVTAYDYGSFESITTVSVLKAELQAAPDDDVASGIYTRNVVSYVENGVAPEDALLDALLLLENNGFSNSAIQSKYNATIILLQ